MSLSKISKDKACLAIILALGTRKTVKRRVWMKEWLKKRNQYSHLTLLREISASNADDYKNYYRMDENLFNMLISMLTPHLSRMNTVMRDPITVRERLAVTLRFLATGRNFEDLKYSVIMSPSAISQAIFETCETLIYVLQDYIKVSK